MCVAIPGDIAAINTNVQVGTKGDNATILPVVNGDAWRPHKLKVSFSERRIEITYKVSLRKWENMHRKPYCPEVFTNLSSYREKRRELYNNTRLLDGKHLSLIHI